MPRTYEGSDVIIVAIFASLYCLLIGASVAHEMIVRHYEYADLLTPWVM